LSRPLLHGPDSFAFLVGGAISVSPCSTCRRSPGHGLPGCAQASRFGAGLVHPRVEVLQDLLVLLGVALAQRLADLRVLRRLALELLLLESPAACPLVSLIGTGSDSARVRESRGFERPFRTLLVLLSVPDA
jgi:hypothetical protein